MRFTSLPQELLMRLPSYLNSIDDWYALIRTCRSLYQICADTKASFSPQFKLDRISRKAPINALPVLAALARQLADWAVQNEDYRQGLWDCIKLGSRGLLYLSRHVAQLTVNDVRAAYKAKKEVVEPVSKILIEECNQRQLEFCGDMMVNLYNFIIYCELFHHSIDQIYDQLPPNIHPLALRTRHQWMIECMPDSLVDRSLARDDEQLDFELQDFEHMTQLASWFNPTHLSRLNLNLHHNIDPLTHVSRHLDDSRYFRLMAHQGLDTLRLMLPVHRIPSSTKELALNIRWKTDSISDEARSALQEERWEGRWEEARVMDYAWCSVAVDVEYGLYSYESYEEGWGGE